MLKNLTIECEDSLDQINMQDIGTTKHYKSSKSPLSKTQGELQYPQIQYCQTPQAHNRYSREKSPYFEFKTPKYKGIAQKTILERLAYYSKQSENIKASKQLTSKIKNEQKSFQQLKQKPQINEVSKILYEKVKQQRKLSPNILERFKTYQRQRMAREAQYDLMRKCNFTLKNNILTCKNALKQKDFNTPKSKSKSSKRYFLPDKSRNKQNIGKLIKTTQVYKRTPTKKSTLQKSLLSNNAKNQSKQKYFYQTQFTTPITKLHASTQNLKNNNVSSSYLGLLKFETETDKKTKSKQNLVQKMKKIQQSQQSNNKRHSPFSPFTKKKHKANVWHVIS